MPGKTRKPPSDGEPLEPFDPNAESFDEFDVSSEPEAAAEATIESLGGLAESDDAFRSVSQARDEVEGRYLLNPSAAVSASAEDGTSGLGNVVGVGIGEKYVDDKPTGQLAVKVFVKEKLNREEVSAEALVPQTIGGTTTDIDAVGDVTAQMFTARLRPAPCGVSIGNCNRVMAGTLGCLVRRGTQLFILSNNHVIALVNTSPLGAGIPQPGRLDGGVCNNDVIARLAQFIPINFAAGQCNFVDAAIAQTSPALVDRRILRPLGFRQPILPPPLNPVLNMLVQKSGRTTQYTRGIVDAVNVTVNVSYAPLGGVARFCRQFRVRGIPGGDFSRPGDSGSLVTTFPLNQPVGLLFAGGAGPQPGSQSVTFCNPIIPVLNAFGVTIVL
jgi:hypothetical protein